MDHIGLKKHITMIIRISSFKFQILWALGIIAAAINGSEAGDSLSLLLLILFTEALNSDQSAVHRATVKISGCVQQMAISLGVCSKWQFMRLAQYSRTRKEKKKKKKKG